MKLIPSASNSNGSSSRDTTSLRSLFARARKWFSLKGYNNASPTILENSYYSAETVHMESDFGDGDSSAGSVPSIYGGGDDDGDDISTDPPPYASIARGCRRTYSQRPVVAAARPSKIKRSHSVLQSSTSTTGQLKRSEPIAITTTTTFKMPPPHHPINSIQFAFHRPYSKVPKDSMSPSSWNQQTRLTFNCTDCQRVCEYDSNSSGCFRNELAFAEFHQFHRLTCYQCQDQKRKSDYKTDYKSYPSPYKNNTKDNNYEY